MMESNECQLDFDHWSEVARRDPAAFESMRQAAISELIESASPERQRRLRGLQWRIDQERRRSTSSMGACIRISNMMWESLLGGGGLLEQLSQLQAAARAPSDLPNRKGKVIPIGLR